MKYLFLAVTALLSMPASAQIEVIERPALNTLQERTEAISGDLDAVNTHHFGQIYSTYSLINTVETVQTDMGKTVAACGKEHPELLEPMSARFSAWSATVDPILSESRAKVDNMIAVQTYADQAEMNALLTAIDATRVESNAMIEKTPVTTEDACQTLLGKMDETEKQLGLLLRRTLASYPVPASE